MNSTPFRRLTDAPPPAAHAIALGDMDEMDETDDATSPDVALALPTLVDQLARSDQADRPANPLHHVTVRLTVSVGSAQVTIGELLDAKAHQVFCLDRAIEEPVDILLGGEVVARGTLVAVDDRFGVRITELPRPLAL